MRVLVIGNGGREDAICKKLSESKKLTKLYCSKGNAGTLRYAENVDLKDNDEIFDFAKYLEEKNESKDLSRGLTHSLLNIWEKNFNKNFNISNEDEWNEDIQNRLLTKSYIPIFKYKLRSINNSQVKECVDKNGIKFMPWIKTPVSWVSLRLR